MPDSTAPSFFVSYSHHDADWRAALFDRCIATTSGDCLVWSDAQLRAGDDWCPQIEAQLARVLGEPFELTIEASPATEGMAVLDAAGIFGLTRKFVGAVAANGRARELLEDVVQAIRWAAGALAPVHLSE